MDEWRAWDARKADELQSGRGQQGYSLRAGGRQNTEDGRGHRKVWRGTEITR
jgi:hypothetical protein